METFKDRRSAIDFYSEKVREGVYLKKLPLKKQKQLIKKTRQLDLEYSFLQYHNMIRKWAVRNYDLTNSELDILFYMYPIGIFTSSDFSKCLKEIGIGGYKTLKNLKDKGMISDWNKVGRFKYYNLSHKASELIKRIHRMHVMEEEIPMSERRNVIARSQSKKDKNLVNLFKSFNEKVKHKNN